MTTKNKKSGHAVSKRKVKIMTVKMERLKEIAREIARHNETYNYPTTPKRKKKKDKKDSMK